MPAGILQPGGAGTIIYVYDSTAAANGVNYTFTEINTAFPNDFELMVGAASGLAYNGVRRQYLQKVQVQYGGQAADGNAMTYLKESNCDVYCRAGAGPLWRTGIPGSLKTEFGTRIASQDGVSGRDGVDIVVASGNVVIRGQMLFYGSEIFSETGTVQLLDSGASGFSEIAGCIMRTNSSFVIGNNTASPSLDIFNSTFASSTVTNMVTTMAVRDSDNFVLAAVSPQSFIATGAASLRLKGGVLVGSPTTADLIWNGAGAGGGWIISDTQFSETLGKPRFAGGFGVPVLAAPTKETWTFNVKVTNGAGLPIIDVPVRLDSDIDGTVVDTKTFGDGDIGFTNGALGVGNAVLTRDHYNPSSVYTVRDRTFTLYVNQAGGTFPAVAGYGGRTIVFQWPGKDTYRGAYQLNGGTFQKIFMPVMLGPPGSGTPNVWRECDINA